MEAPSWSWFVKTRVLQAPGEVFIGLGQRLQLSLHLGFQGEKLGLVPTFALFGEGLVGLSFALIGLLAQDVAFLRLWPSSMMRTSSWICS